MNTFEGFAGQLWQAALAPIQINLFWPGLCVLFGICCFIRAHLLSRRDASGRRPGRMVSLGLALVVFGLIWLMYAMIASRIWHALYPILWK